MNKNTLDLDPCLGRSSALTFSCIMAHLIQRRTLSPCRALGKRRCSAAADLDATKKQRFMLCNSTTVTQYLGNHKSMYINQSYLAYTKSTLTRL